MRDQDRILALSTAWKEAVGEHFKQHPLADTAQMRAEIEKLGHTIEHAIDLALVLNTLAWMAAEVVRLSEPHMSPNSFISTFMGAYAWQQEHAERPTGLVAPVKKGRMN